MPGSANLKDFNKVETAENFNLPGRVAGCVYAGDALYDGKERGRASASLYTRLRGI